MDGKKNAMLIQSLYRNATCTLSFSKYDCHLVIKGE